MTSKSQSTEPSKDDYSETNSSYISGAVQEDKGSSPDTDSFNTSDSMFTPAESVSDTPTMTSRGMNLSHPTPLNGCPMCKFWLNRTHAYCTQAAQSAPKYQPPVRDQTFVILDTSGDRELTMEFGVLGMSSTTRNTTASHWLCQQQSGWLGFLNAATGTYLGHDGNHHKKNIVAKAGHLKAWEYFTVQLHSDGGFVLQVLHYSDLWNVSIVGDKLVATPDGKGDIFHFLKV